MTFARQLWQRIETIHAVTYFAPESTAAAKGAGLRGFWMGYFGFRAAPLGAVGSGAVEAAFANFEPTMVRRAIPDAWSFADPSDLVGVRAAAAARALRAASRSIDTMASEANEVLENAIGRCDTIGRPLFAANRLIEPFADPVERLWQNCTTLREHRGDGHVAALVAAGIGGLQAHLLLAAAEGLAPEVFLDHRGWSDEHRSVAENGLIGCGLLGADGITEAGREFRSQIEMSTDELAGAPFDGLLDDSQRGELLERIGVAAAEVIAADVLPFPNPMGLPRLTPR